jgi:hypothetical protein
LKSAFRHTLHFNYVGYLKKITACYALWVSAMASAELQVRTAAAFDDYTHRVETRLGGSLKGSTFLWADQSPERSRQVRQGQVLAESLTGKEPVSLPGALIHDWVGAVFIPGAAVEKVLLMLQDYDRHKDFYRPEVTASRLVSRNGNDFKIHLRLQKKKVITVVLDTDYDVHYVPVDSTHWYSSSLSTRIQEVENAGTPGESTLPAGNDRGFLWRLDSYWRFLERDSGVYVECEAVSLTRDTPRGLGWLIEPVIRDLPRESLINTLRKTREAMGKE